MTSSPNMTSLTNTTPKLILFDFDGTIVDSEYLILTSMTTAFIRNQLEAPPPDETRQVIGLSLEQAIATLAPDHSPALHKDIVNSYKQTYVELRDERGIASPLYPGVRACLDALHAEPDFLLGIATGKSRKGLQKALQLEQLADYFFISRTPDEAHSKPHPDMIEQCLAATGVAPCDAVMIGDSRFDMQMAKAAGTGAIGVAWGFQPVETLIAAGADMIATDYNQLESLIRTRLTDQHRKPDSA